MAIIASVNRSLFRRSGILKTFFRFESTWSRLVQVVRRASSGPPSRPVIVRDAWSAVGKLVALDGRATGLSLRLERQRNERHRTASGRDRRLGRLRDGVGMDLDLGRQLAAGEHLDVVRLAGQAVLEQRLQI